MRAVSFADVLDMALRRIPGEPARLAAATAASATGGHPQAARAFLFTRPLTSAAPRWPALPGTAVRRPDHPFTDAERRAFNRLLDLGARLEPDFSAEDLRREYRRLAPRYHPDRHSARSAVERDSLARTFADVTDCCRRLRSLVEPRH